MARAPVGAVVRLTYDGFARLKVGDFLRTKTSRYYLILSLRRQARGKHKGRAHLACLVADPPTGDNLGEAAIFPLFWYPRSRRNGK